jgi:hypothetical protein
MDRKIADLMRKEACSDIAIPNHALTIRSIGLSPAELTVYSYRSPPLSR